MDANDIVGHKTLRDGSHEPLTRKEADQIRLAVNANKQRIAELMPDEQAALHMFTDAFHRLMDFGWSEAMYCPKDGSMFHVIEAGSSGIHDCCYDGTWPNGYYEIHTDDDICYSRPVLYRKIASAEQSQ